MAQAKGAETLHARIIEDLRGRIVDGTWVPGFQLPRETDLAQDFGVSRMTMNKVLTQLAQEGFLVRRKRSGTFVAQPRAQSAVLEITNIADEVGAQGRAHRWSLLARELRQMTQADLRLLGVQRPRVDEPALILRGVHFADDAPFCLETRAIDLDVVPDAETADFAAHPPGAWLLGHMPWTTARHQIRAVTVTGSDARALGLPSGNACLEILRKTEVNARWVTYARLLYPGEAHQLVAEFGP
ncbi:UTRA domain-containing protein [Thetidibacter halocola]|uniref:UTRA domain-containing protein n=1 Tax=Thetidibacter halocola TaxID=2827239 RepID=A0A8J7WAN6_9RHOB|nr:UTRA domain-containing protein [Thetidibacter halocola]MBS0124055.1 UTRA domain-containing protein [Thetidibacter halocola]